MPRRACVAGTELKQRGFIFDGSSLDLRVMLKAIEVFVSEPFNLGLLGLADPNNFNLHGEILNTASTAGTEVISFLMP